MSYFFAARITEDNLERLDTLTAALGLAGNRSAALRAILDAPLPAILLAVNVNQSDMLGAGKETARQRQTGGTAARATGDGVNRLSSDTDEAVIHVVNSNFTPNG